MKISSTPLRGVVVAESSMFSDQRGSFSRLYCEHELEKFVDQRRIVQVNHSRTRSCGAVRGLHYQHPPHAEMKMVRCLRGRVWDVALDLRTGSPTFLKWHAEELSPDNARMMIIPEGVAHGFQALEADTELLYLHTQFYVPEAEGGISCTDPRIGIDWPLAIADISRRDASHPPLTQDFQGISL